MSTTSTVLSCKLHRIACCDVSQLSMLFPARYFTASSLRRENEKKKEGRSFCSPLPRLLRIATDCRKLSLVAVVAHRPRRVLSCLNKFAATFSSARAIVSWNKASLGCCGADSARTFYPVTVHRDVTRRHVPHRKFSLSLSLSSQTVHPSTTCDVVQRRSLCRTCCVTRGSASLTAVSSLSPSFSLGQRFLLIVSPRLRGHILKFSAPYYRISSPPAVASGLPLRRESPTTNP